MLGVANAGGPFHAFDATCTAEGGPLVGGRLEAGATTSPWHGYRFALATGEILAPGVDLRVRLFRRACATAMSRSNPLSSPEAVARCCENPY